MISDGVSCAIERFFPRLLDKVRDARLFRLAPGEQSPRSETSTDAWEPEERGHFRRLTSEYYKHKRGAVIWVRPCWVGPQEGIVGNNRYIVRLDADRPPADDTSGVSGGAHAQGASRGS